MTSEASITISERKNWKFIYLKKSLTRTVKAAPLDTLANASANAYKVKRLLQGSASDWVNPVFSASPGEGVLSKEGPTGLLLTLH